MHKAALAFEMALGGATRCALTGRKTGVGAKEIECTWVRSMTLLREPGETHGMYSIGVGGNSVILRIVPKQFPDLKLYRRKTAPKLKSARSAKSDMVNVLTAGKN